MEETSEKLDKTERLGQVMQGFISAARRFPLSFLCMFASFFLAIGFQHLSGNAKDVTSLLGFSFVIGAPYFAAIRIWCEAKKFDKPYDLWIGIPVYFAIMLPLWSGGRITDIVPFYIPVFAAIVLAFFSAPYFFRKSDNASYWYYQYLSKTALFFAIASSLIFCIGVTMCFGAFAYLFGIKVPGDFYAYIWCFGIFIMGPAYLLAHTPKEFDYEREDCAFPVGVHYIQKFILIPLALAVTAMFYLYFAQILLLGDMPKGKIGWMVSGFSVVGILTYLTIYPVHEKSGRLMAWFYRWFFALLIIPTTLLGWAIYTRISEYGVTIERYMLAAICLALVTWIAIYFFRDRQFELKYFAAVVILFLLVSAAGPFSAASLSVMSQKQQLHDLLSQHDLFDAQGIYQKPADKTKISFEDEKRISHLVRYLNDRRALNELRPWFADKAQFDQIFEDTDKEDYATRRRRHHYDADNELVAMMGFSYLGKYHRAEDHDATAVGRRVYLTPMKKKAQTSYKVLYSVSGYDFTADLDMYMRNRKANQQKWSYQDAKQNWQTLTVSVEEGVKLHVKDHKEALIGSFDFAQIPLPEKPKERQKLERADLYLEIDLTNGGKASLQLERLEILWDAGKITKINQIEGQFAISSP